MATLRSLNIAIRASSAYLSGDFNKASRLASQFQRDVTRSFKGISDSVLNVKTALAALLGTAGFTALIKSSYDSIDALAKQADKLGITTQAMAELQYAAQSAGVNSDRLNVYLVSMQQNIGKLYQGINTTTEAFKALNLTSEDLKGLKADQQFKLIVDRLNQVSDATAKVSIETAIFGKLSSNVLNIIKNGSEGLTEAAKEAQAFGLSISRIDAAKIEAVNDNFTKIKDVAAGVGNTIAIALAGPLKIVTDDIINAAVAQNGFRDEINKTVQAATNGVGSLLIDVGSAVNYVANNPAIGELGLLGFTFFGRKGLLAGAIIGEEISKLKEIYTANFGDLSPTQKQLYNLNNQIADNQAQLAIWMNELDRRSDKDNIYGKIFGNTGGEDAAVQQVTQFSSRLADLQIQAGKLETSLGQSGLNDLLAKLGEANDKTATFGNSIIKLGNDLKNYQAGKTNPFKLPTPETPAPTGNLGFDISAIDDLEKSMRTQEQVIAESYARRAEIVGNALQAGVIDQSKAYALLMQLDQKYQADRVQAEIQSNAEVTSARNNFFNNAAQLLDLLGQKNKGAALAALAIQKGLAIAETIVNTQVAAVRALAELGPIAGPPAAATIETLGSASVALIAATGILQAKNITSPQKYAKGGIVDGSTTFIAGEAGPKAIVPLPDGRSIPVDFRSPPQQSSQQPIVVNLSVSAIDARGVDAVLMARAPTIAAAVQKVYNRNARLGGPYR